MFAFPKSRLPLAKQALASLGIWCTLILGVIIPCFMALWLRGVGIFVRALCHPLPSPPSSELGQPWECGPSAAWEGPVLDTCLIYVITEMLHSRWARPPGLHLRFAVLQGVENYKRGLLEQDRGVHGFAFFLLSLYQITSTICRNIIHSVTQQFCTGFCYLPSTGELFPRGALWTVVYRPANRWWYQNSNLLYREPIRSRQQRTLGQRERIWTLPFGLWCSASRDRLAPPTPRQGLSM